MLKTLTFAAFALLISGCLTEVVAPDVALRSSDSNIAGPTGVTIYGSVTLSWTAPTYNTDGSVLTDLDGYRIYWGTTPGRYSNSVTIENESITIFVLQNIPVGTYEFVATSFNSAGIESSYSNPVTKVVL